MLYGNGGGMDNNGSGNGGNARFTEGENRRKRLELVDKIGKLTSKVVELQRENEDLQFNNNIEDRNNVENNKNNRNSNDNVNALELHEREEKLKSWSETLKRQQNYLDEESLSLATDLKQLKNREERLRRVTDDALNHGGSNTSGVNASINASLDNSWSNALGLE